MRVWVSGAGGFTGRPLVRALEASGHVVCASKADCRDGEAVGQEIGAFDPNALIHLAAISQPQHQPVEDFYRVNVVGTSHVLAAAQSLSDVHQVILASSATVYGAAARSHAILSEAAIAQPVGHYALSKFAMEQLAHAYPDLPILIVRPFNYTGPGQSEAFLFGKIAIHLGRGASVLELGNLALARDFTWLDDVVKVYVSCINTSTPLRGLCNVCSGVAQSLEDLVAALVRHVDASVQVTSNGALHRGAEIPRLAGDTTHLHALIGTVPRALKVEMLLEMVDAARRSERMGD